ncbi:MAG: L-threonylcarbamoyladenylate synthase [Candidatus Methylacidiphilales bacterium]|nr:L-threonylcarbamoyladenylate synthase [Candidatus Methylacidiphilales bacterium]
MQFSHSNLQPADSRGIARAVELLRAGEAVALPTETVYGLGGDGLRESALAKIFEIKGRPRFDPLILHVTSLAEAEALTLEWPAEARRLAEKFWPGPLTLVLPKRDIVPHLATSGQPTAALRCPSHPVMRQVIAEFGGPIAAPSANRFGRISPTTAAAVATELGTDVPLILDAGPCAVGLESTIVGWHEGRPLLLRAGGLPREDIEAITGPLERLAAVESSPLAPGQLKSHYAPRKPLLIVNRTDFHEVAADIPADARIGLLTFARQTLPSLSHEFPASFPAPSRTLDLSPTGNLAEAATRFFGALRELDEDSTVDRILAIRLPDHGLGLAINERLSRAEHR